MKSKLMLVLFGVCFSLFLLLGIKASQFLFSGGDQPLGKTRQTSAPVLLQEGEEDPPPVNPFTLIIFVDDLTRREPLLEGVWLSRSGDELGTKLFFPVFPSQAEDGEDRDLNLKGTFWLEEPYRPSTQFMTILSDRNLTWSYTMFLDHKAALEIGYILQESNQELFPIDAAGLSAMTYSVENRLAARENQALFIRNICQQLPLPGQHELMQRFLEGFGGHLQISGMTHLEFYSDFQGRVQCFFPTLNLPVY
jgi:hypothetical protein